MIIIAIFLLQLATTRLDAASKLDELTSILDGPQKAKLVEEKEKPLGEKIDESKIHHGFPITNIHEFPFMVSLWVGGRRLCTASIISPSHILSAAHCFGLEGNYSVLAGTVDAILNNTNSVQRTIKKASIYAEDLFGKDLAIGEGDSGGPLLYFNPKREKYEQIGITSRGSWMCEFKGFFTQINLYCDWIKKTTDGKAECR